MNKLVLRKLIYKRITNISQDEREVASQKMLNYAKVLLDSYSKISIYQALINELSLKHLINYCINQHKTLYNPIAYAKHKIMRFEQCSAQLKKTNENNFLSIFYPDNYEPQIEIQWYNLDLILVPLIAADKAGNRLGKGGGYYDKTLANIANLTTKPILCGVGYDCQLIDYIKADKWDISVDYFVSEKRLIKF